MTFRPSITDYIATLENPVGMFRTLASECPDGLLEVERDIYGEIDFRAGNSAAVFTYMRNGKRRLLKLYIRPNPYLSEIYEYVERIQSPILPCVRLLRDELFVLSPSGASGWVDVVEGEWVEGETLNVAIARFGNEVSRKLSSPNTRAFIGLPSDSLDSFSIRPKNILRNSARGVLTGISLLSGKPAHPRLIQTSPPLLEALAELFRELKNTEWAHGDLKPENIVVSQTHPNSKTSLGITNKSDETQNQRPKMTLIDCDAMWIPSFAGRPAVELGTPPWSTPGRTEKTFDKTIDYHAMEQIALYTDLSVNLPSGSR